MLKQIRPPQSTVMPSSCPAPRIDLKVCEGCGALWVRAQAGSTPAGVYCRRCAGRLSSFPAPRGLRPSRRPRLARLHHLAAQPVPAAFAAAASTGGAR